MTILVDIDSTISNFAEVLLYFNNKHNQTNYKYTDIISYEWFDKTFPNPWLDTKYKYFWDKIKINSEAVKYIESWAKQNCRVYLVTASHFNDALGYKINRTLKQFNPSLIGEKNIIVAQDKSIIMGDVMIDDYVNNLTSFSGEKICFSQPWNRNYQGIRSRSWSVINSLINKINQK